MAFPDFISAAAAGYQFTWRARRALLKLAGVPFFIKVACFFAITAAGLDMNYLRQGLLLLPAYFAEGWFVACALRLAMPDATQNQVNDEPIRELTSSMILYVLIKLGVAFISGLILMNKTLAMPLNSAQPDAMTFFTGFILLTLLIWSFRFLWVYIPLALDQKIMPFLKALRGNAGSFYLIATWLACFAPFAFLLLFAAQILGAFFPIPEGAAVLGSVYTYALEILQAADEMVIALVSSLAVFFGVEALKRKSRD